MSETSRSNPPSQHSPPKYYIADDSKRNQVVFSPSSDPIKIIEFTMPEAIPSTRDQQEEPEETEGKISNFLKEAFEHDSNIIEYLK